MICRVAILVSALACPAASDCRQALVLGLDVSGSVDSQEYRLQLDGLAAALQSDAVTDALLDPSLPPVWLTVFEWAGADAQRIVVPWVPMEGPAEIGAVAARLRDTKRAIADEKTGLGPAISVAVEMVGEVPDCAQRTIDLSGDGRANHGPGPSTVAVPRGIVINGLVIGADAPATGDRRQMQVGEIAAYYRAEVIRGPGAFVEVALGFEQFEEAMTRKLLREIRVLVLGKSPRPPGWVDLDDGSTGQ